MKAQEFEKIEKMEKLIAEAERNPLIQKLRDEEAAEILRKREEAAKRIADYEMDMQVTAILDREIEELKAKLLEVEQEAKEIKMEINRKTVFKANEKNSIEGLIRHEQAFLFETSDPRINEAIIFFKDKLDWLRSPGRISHNAVGSERNIFTETVTVKEESNVAAIKDCLRYCQNSIPDLDLMKLRPEVDLQKIEEMKRGIPDINVFTESEGVRSMPKGPDPSFIAKIWRGLDNNIERLLKKRI